MERLSTTLFSLYRGSPDHGRWVVACLEGAWQGLVGEQIARACRPAAWEQQCLTVEIVDESWAESLVSLKDEILERIRVAAGDEVREIRFRESPR